MNTTRLMSGGLISAVAASLCCIPPVLALIAGSSSIVSNFSWIEPARPYLIGVTVLVLGFAWYRKIKPQPVDECGCAVDDKPKFFQTKTFLLIVTLFAALMITLPYYAKAFFPKNDKSSVVLPNFKTQTIEFGIKGMTCEACEEHIKMEVDKLQGIVSINVSYAKRNASVQFDPEKTNAKEITKAINSTGYKVVSQTSKN